MTPSSGRRDETRMSNVVDLIWAQAKATPQAIAIQQEGQQLSYADVVAQANRCANFLKQNTRQDRQTVVSFMSSRAPSEIIGLLAALKAGCLVVPLDPEWPNERNSLIIEHSQAELFICDELCRERVILNDRCGTFNITDLLASHTDGPAPESQLDSTRNTTVKAEQPALLNYIRVDDNDCKAATLKHIQLYSLINFLQNKPGFKSHHCLGMISSIASHWGIIEALLPLCVGGRIDILTNTRSPRTPQLQPENLLPRISRSHVTHLQLSTDLLTRFVVACDGWPKGMPPYIWLGGERIPEALSKAIPPELDTIWNFFGLPETGGWTTVYEMNKSEEKNVLGTTHLPLGQAIDNLTLNILDAKGKPVKHKQVGTLWISGPALTESYLREPDLNTALLIPNDRQPDVKLFNTGLRVVREANRSIALEQLSDFSINLYEFRLDPEDIENKLKRNPIVDNAFVQIINAPTACKLHAIVQVPQGLIHDQNITEMLNNSLRESLPSFCIPEQIKLVIDIPTDKPLPRYVTESAELKNLPPLADVPVLLEDFAPENSEHATAKNATSTRSTEAHYTAKTKAKINEESISSESTKETLSRDPFDPAEAETTAAISRQKLTDANYTAPKNEIETHIADCFAELIRYEKVGIETDFYHLADSITLGLFCLRLRKYYQLSSDGQMIPFSSVLEAKNLRELAQSLTKKPEFANVPPIPSGLRQGFFKMTTLQRQAWYIEALNPGGALNNLSFQIEIKGPLSVDTLEASINTILEQQEILRCEVHRHNKLPVMRPAEQARIQLRVVNIKPKPNESISDILRAKGLFLQRQPIAMTKAPLLRCLLIRYKRPKSEQDEIETPDLGYVHFLHITAHRLIWDERSTALFLQSLNQIYAQQIQNEQTQLTPPPYQYYDYFEWQEREDRSRTQVDMTFWREQLTQGLPEPTVLQTTPHTEQDIPPFDEQIPHRFELRESLVSRLNQFAQRERTSVPTVLLSIYAILLARYIDQEELLIGCQTDSRLAPDSERLLGPFNNIVPLRIHVNPALTAQQYIRKVIHLSAQAYAHQSIAFDHLVQAFSQKRRRHEPALITASFSVARINDIPQTLGSCEMKLAPPLITPGNRTFHLHINYDQETIIATFYSRLAYIHPQTAEKMAAHYERLLSLFTKTPDQQLRHFNVLSDQDLQRILVQYNQRQQKFLPANSIAKLVSTQATTQVNKTAVVAQDQTLNYAILEQKSNQTAHALLRAGLKCGDICAVCLARTIDLPVMLLAIWKCGAAVLPIDPRMSDTFNRKIFAHAEPAFFIADTPFMPLSQVLLKNGNKTTLLSRDKIAYDIEPKTTPPIKRHEDDMAYLFYLSLGRSGLKGISVPHSAVINFLQSMLITPGMSVDDRVLALSPVSFDDHIFEIWLPLCRGATTYLKETDSSVLDILGAIDAHDITTLQAPVETWSRIQAANWDGAPHVRGFVGGSGINKSLIDFFAARLGSFWCFYGTTETTIWNTAQKLASSLPETLIGKPLHNIEVYILSDNGYPTPEGCSGNFYIGGACLTDGYFKDSAKTEKRFQSIKLPDGSTKTLFRTDDKATWHPGGNLEYRAGQDQFLKIDGHRIDLSEIEKTIEHMPKVHKAVVTTSVAQHFKTLLTAYVVPVAGSMITPQDVQEFLTNKLPAHATPSKICCVIALPTKPDGEIDRDALPAPEDIIKGRLPQPSKPTSPIEKRIALMWRLLLKIEKISLDDNFFDLGGHSLLALAFIQAIEETSQRHLSLQDLSRQTLAQIAQQITQPAEQPVHEHIETKPKMNSIFKRTKKR
jgi:non-ribosomal peptide synthetase component F